MEMLSKLLNQAKTSRRALWKLNFFLLSRIVPFNRPHRFKVHKIEDHALETFAPYRRSNLNHIRGTHACAIGTVSEMAAGLLLLCQFPPTKYRLIMAKLSTDYHYQGKQDLIARCELSGESFSSIAANLLNDGRALIDLEVKVMDTEDNHVATTMAQWQIKPWARVKTKLQ